ncbi:conserved hypothetical protein [Nautilia profundicola AmH]|uniref:Plasminogen-binding protein PgbA N-terminal domain-containing protein n=1 Tax=Nautilia profundicola (strain ATCC BAA-1463 / DSM 18972 / AmH) TaxID=598659 RepID=B9L9B1_NAUPA|nr:plasminogen-binding N-terminal domain-containing protein [Nautilia profundicola]ACM93549.1 conserved hypothetical protein [Nautilia profundicola AmH]
MRWLFWLLAAVLLSGYEVSITNINGDVVTLDKYVKKGVSGVVLCPFEGKHIICAKAVTYGKKAKLKVYDNLKNEAFALPVVLPKKGDKILLAKNYNRILIIAPNQYLYLKTKENYKNAIIINPDNFAAFLEDIPTREEFINFAKKMDIGRYVFVLDKIYEVDADSFYAIKKYGKNSQKFKEMFFTTYPKFDINDKNMIAYYKSLIKE